MRKPEREIKDRETMTGMLEKALVGRMATINRKGYPVIKPLNFLYYDSKIYFHCSMKGEKMQDIRRGSLVCFEIDEPIAYVAARGPACQAGYYYRSIIIKGSALWVRHRGKKLEILEKLMEKYQPEGGYGEVSDEILKKTAVVEISIHEMTGKQKLG